MMNNGELVMDIGTVLDGEGAVQVGLIDELGGLQDALGKLYDLIDEEDGRKKPRRGRPPKAKPDKEPPAKGAAKCSTPYCRRKRCCPCRSCPKVSGCPARRAGCR